MSNKNLITQEESTELTLRKATDIINRTNKILKNSKKELVANLDVTIIDGKMWQKETVEDKMTWDEAMEYAKNLRLGGYDDWRLPIVDEFRSVISGCGGINIKAEKADDDIGDIVYKNEINEFYHNCLEKKGFKSESDDWYWSSTTYSNNTLKAWIVYFNYGYTYNYTKDYHIGSVRCMRG